MDSQLILVDEKDNKLGYGTLKDSHTGLGKRHRAFVTLLFNDNDQVLLQKRKHRLFDGLWDLTAISHPLRINRKDETFQEASDRALKKEMGITGVQVVQVGAFNYFARDGKNCENEYCAVLTGDFSGSFKPNKDEVYEAKWVKFDEFISDTRKNSQKYTPWARKTVKILVNGKLLVVHGSNQNNFKSELAKFLKVFEPYQKKYFERKIKEVSNYPNLISRFYKDLADFSAGGKKLRAFLVYLGYKVGNVKVSPLRVMPICLAVELVHNFLLIHDDIIDQSDKRRGRPTIHKRYGKSGSHYGISQAIVIGDLVCLEAIKLINESVDEVGLKTRLLEKFIKTIIETVYGQALDVDYSQKRPNLDKILDVTNLKTARYSFVGPLTIGAILSGSGNGTIDALSEFGMSLGTAFQLQDDILGVFGNEKTLGKSNLSDMREGKNTLLFYKTRELAGGIDSKKLEKIWGNQNSTKNDLKMIQEIITKTGSLKWCQHQMTKLAQNAKKSIPQITEDSHYRKVLLEIADFVINRQK